MAVLLVEDNPGDARLFEEYLRESNQEFHLRHELTLEAGLEALQEERPDVLAVDLGLPDSEGAETVKAVAGAAPKVPIVVLTGQEDLEAALQAQEAGAAEYVQKDELTPTLAGRTLRWATQQARMQRKLRQRDAWIRSITENVAGGLFRAGPTGRIEYANRALAEMLGFEEEARLIGRDLTAFYADPSECGQMLAEEGADGVEVTFERQDGSTFVGLLSAEAAYDAEGRVLQYDGVITDITEQKETQQELARSESLTRSVLDALAANVAVLDEDGTIIEVNEQWNQFGRDNEGNPDTIGEGNNYLEACEAPSPSGAYPGASVREDLRAVIEGDRDFFEHEYPCHGPEEERWFLLRATPLNPEGGGAVVAHINVTERIKAVRQQRILSEAVDQAKESVLITEAGPLAEPGPRIEYVNRAFEEMTGYSEAEVLGETPRILQGPETDRDVLDSLRAALEAGEEWQGETVNYRKDGTPYRVQWNVSPVTDDAGEIAHWVSVQRDVTEERAREEELRRQKALLEQTQRLAGAWEIDLDSGAVSASEKVYEIHELDPGTEIEAKEILDFYPSEARERALQAFRRCATDGTPYDLELPLDTANGNRRWIRTVAGPVEDEDGDIVKVAGAFQDITEQKEAEATLRDQEAQLRGLANSIPGVVFQAYARPGREYGFYLVSEHAEELLGISGDPDGFFERCLHRVPEEEREQLIEAINRAVDQEVRLRFEAPFVKPSGKTIWLLGTATPERRGKELIYNGVILDITKRKETEQELKRSRERLQMATEAGTIGTWDWDLETGEVIFNRQWAEMLGYSREELDFHFSTWEELVHPDDLPRAMEVLGEYIQGKRDTYAPEIRMQTKSGEWKWIQTIGKVVDRDEDGEVTRASGVHLDVDERKRRERELVEAKEEAEEANRLKSAFLANMSHEIRTPLTSILGFAEAIGEETGGAEAPDEINLPMLSEFSGLIQKSGYRLMETLDLVLNLSRLEAGEMNLKLEPVDLAAQAKEIAEEFALEAEKAGVDLTVSVPEAPVWARADEGGVRIAGRNLVSNAIKYTEAGGTAQVRVYTEEDGTIFEVEDTGIGMDPSRAQELFAAFKQASEGIGREYEGSGLGLTVTEKVLTEMGGAISVETEKGEGTRFIVRLPRADERGG